MRKLCKHWETFFIRICLELSSTAEKHSHRAALLNRQRPKKTNCFLSVLAHSMTQLNDLHWHSKLHLNYQFGSYTETLDSVCVAAICHSNMLGFSVLGQKARTEAGEPRVSNVNLALLQHIHPKSVTELHWCIWWLPRKWKTGLRGLWEDTVAGN